MTRDPTRIISQLQNEADQIRSKLDALKQAVKDGDRDAVRAAATSLRFAQNAMRRKTRDIRGSRVLIPPGLTRKPPKPQPGQPPGGAAPLTLVPGEKKDR